MLKLAVKASLPLIHVHSNDLVNLKTVLEAVIGKEVFLVDTIKQSGQIAPLLTNVIKGRVYYWISPKPCNWLNVYSNFAKKAAILIVINPQEKDSSMYEGGVLTAPPKLVKAFVQKYAKADQVNAIVSSFAGLTYKELIEITKLAMTRYGVYSARAVRAIRREYFGSVSGLKPINTDYLFYKPSQELVQWLKVDGQLLIPHDVPKALRPRGLLFKGPPGTGKTLGAKFLANELDLPLYLMEMAGVLGKYQGESDKNLRNLLVMIDSYAPCILLIDEVDKLFAIEDDSGVSQRILSQLLWWLQEHRSSVFTIMTTNKEESIPDELYRPGRIDRDVYFGTMSLQEAQQFVADLAIKLGVTPNLKLTTVMSGTPAALTTLVLHEAKKQYLTNATNML